MKIQYCSDLHLEFPANKKYLKANPIKPEGDILLLGGDIIPFAEMEKENDFFNFLSDSFGHTYWIPGNHEYYRSDITESTGTFSTLWSKINPTFEYVIKKSMADFHMIKNNGRKISGDDYDQLHEDCRAFLAKELSTVTNLKTIVITHHLPTFLNYPEKYRDSELNSAFATELFDLIEPSNVDYWSR